MIAPTSLRDEFVNAMSFAASTVSIVTTDGPAGRFGATVSAMSSVSADGEKPTLLVCVNEKSRTAAALIENGVFSVNVLRDDQSEISDTFAGRYGQADADKFACTTWTTGATGAPYADAALVAFDCRISTSQKVGTHHVVVGEVEAIHLAGTGSPLVYANRAYGSAAPLERRPAPAGETLRLGVFHTFGPYVVPRILSDFPGGASLVEGDQTRVLAALTAGRIDLALTYDIDLPKGLEVERLGSLAPMCVLPEGHPLAARPSLRLADLAAEPLVLLDAEPSGSYFLSLFEAAGVEPNIAYRSTSFEMVRGLVARGLGYAILATKPASAMSYDGSALVTRAIVDELAPSHIALVTLKGATPPERARLFAERCRALFRTASVTQLQPA